MDWSASQAPTLNLHRRPTVCRVGRVQHGMHSSMAPRPCDAQSALHRVQPVLVRGQPGHCGRRPNRLPNHLTQDNSSECSFLLEDLPSTGNWYTLGGGPSSELGNVSPPLMKEGRSWAVCSLERRPQGSRELSARITQVNKLRDAEVWGLARFFQQLPLGEALAVAQSLFRV